MPSRLDVEFYTSKGLTEKDAKLYIESLKVQDVLYGKYISAVSAHIYSKRTINH